MCFILQQQKKCFNFASLIRLRMLFWCFSKSPKLWDSILSSLLRFFISLDTRWLTLSDPNWLINQRHSPWGWIHYEVAFDLPCRFIYAYNFMKNLFILFYKLPSCYVIKLFRWCVSVSSNVRICVNSGQKMDFLKRTPIQHFHSCFLVSSYHVSII